jgi:hypothetical protein
MPHITDANVGERQAAAGFAREQFHFVPPLAHPLEGEIAEFWRDGEGRVVILKGALSLGASTHCWAAKPPVPPSNTNAANNESGFHEFLFFISDFDF